MFVNGPENQKDTLKVFNPGKDLKQPAGEMMFKLDLGNIIKNADQLTDEQKKHVVQLLEQGKKDEALRYLKSSMKKTNNEI